MSAILGQINFNSNLLMFKNRLEFFPQRGNQQKRLRGIKYQILVQKHAYEDWIIGNKKDFLFLLIGNVTNLADFSHLVENSPKTRLEILFQAYERYSAHLAEKLAGNFIFLVYNKKNNQVDVFKSFFSNFPLYYTYQNKVFSFSSKVRPLLNMSPGFSFSINKQAVIEYFLFMNLCNPQTMFEKVYCLQFGEQIRINRKRLKKKIFLPKKIYQLNEKCSLKKGLEIFETGMRNSIKASWRKKARDGLMTSGGIDSSLIGFYLNQLTPKLKIFHCLIEEYYQKERKLFEVMQQKLKPQYYSVRVNNVSYADQVEELIWDYGEPLRGKNLPLYQAIARLAVKQKVNQLWSGLMSETMMFKGMKKNLWIADWKKLNYERKMVLQHTSVNYEDLKRTVRNFKQIEEALAVRLNLIKYILDLGLSRPEIETYYQFFIEGSRLTRVEEKGLSDFGIGVLLPLIHPIFLETLKQIPHSLLNLKGKKILLAKLYERNFNQSTKKYQKIGLGAPNREWFKNKEGIGRFLKLINEKSLLGQYFKINAVKQLTEYRLNNARAPLDYFIWPLVNLEIFLNYYQNGIKSIKEKKNGQHSCDSGASG